MDEIVTATSAAAAERATTANLSTTATVGAVVIGGDYQGLGIARSLGRHRIPVCVIDDEFSVSRFSRYVDHFVSVPDLRDVEQTIQALLETGRRLKLNGWVLFPTRDETVAALSLHKHRLEEIFRVPTPAWSVVESAWDKRQTYQLAEELGIPTPQTWRLRKIDELRGLKFSFPIAIKPAIKEHFFYATRAKAWRANNWTELESLFARAVSQVGVDEVILQDIIPGDGHQQFAYCAFFKDGSSLGSMAVRRTRQHPPEFGRASTYVETIDHPALAAMSERFLRAIDYYGLVEMEYKLDLRDGEYKLLDVNARTWGYHSLGHQAGVDFPYQLYCDQLGKSVERQCSRPAVSWIRHATDLPTAIAQIFSGRLGLGEYLRSVLGADVSAVFAWKDPLPAAAELFLIPYMAVKRGF